MYQLRTSITMKKIRMISKKRVYRESRENTFTIASRCYANTKVCEENNLEPWGLFVVIVESSL